MTDTERRYSNIERELLGVVFGLKRLHHYTFGKFITVETDHQPLTSIWKKTIATSSPRLQRLLLRLAQYDVPLRQRKCHSRYIIQGSTPTTRATRLQHQSKQHRKDPSSPNHTKSHQQVQRDYKRYVRPQQRIQHYDYWQTQYMKGGPKQSDTVLTVYSHTVILVFQR